MYLLSLDHSLGTENTDITQTCSPAHIQMLTAWYKEQRRAQALTVQHEKGCEASGQRKDRLGKFPEDAPWYRALPESRRRKGVP